MIAVYAPQTLELHLSNFVHRESANIGKSLNPAGISTILKTLQDGVKSNSNKQPLSGHSFRVGAALDLLKEGEPLEKIMLRGG